MHRMRLNIKKYPQTKARLIADFHIENHEPQTVYADTEILRAAVSDKRDPLSAVFLYVPSLFHCGHAEKSLHPCHKDEASILVNDRQ